MKKKISRVVLITGVSSGIGKTTAEYFAQMGDKVYGMSRRKIQDENIYSICGDVTNDADVKRVVKEVIDIEGKIDVLVNNAGMGISGAIEMSSMESIEKQMNTNFMGAVRMTKEVLPYMRERGDGHIINITSPAGSIFPMPYQAFYASSKGALEMFTLSLRVEVKPFNIKVCTVMPGDTCTGFTDAREKSENKDNPYKNQDISIGRMEKYERKGMDPIKVAKVIYKVSTRKNPAPSNIVGGVYKLYNFLNRIVPKRMVLWILPKFY